MNHLEIPAVVVELGYISSDKDRQHLVDSMYHKNMARAICTGIINYFNNSRTADISMNPEMSIYYRDSEVQVNNSKLPNLYFVPKTKTRLFIASKEMTPVDTANGTVEKLARLALEQLVDGPRQREALSPCISNGIALRDLKISGSLATVDLAATSNGFIGSEGEWIVVSSIAFTLFEFPEYFPHHSWLNQRKLLMVYVPKITLTLRTRILPQAAGH